MDLYCFDFSGVYLGHIDLHGVLFDRRGTKWAALRDGGTLYDFAGRYRGRVDPQGSLYAEDGHCRGYVRDWHGALVTHHRPPIHG